MSKKLYLGSELIATNSMLENAIDKIDSRIDDEVSAVNERIDTEVEALRAVDAGLQGEIDELAEEIGGKVPTPTIEAAGKAIVVDENGEYTLREAGVPQELIDRVDALENETAALSEEKLNAPELIGNAGKIIIVSEDEKAAEVSEYAVADIIDYADSVAAQEAQAAEQSAKDYADSKASVAEQSAKDYADSKASAAEQSAKDYADSVAADAEVAAKGYAHSEDVALKEVIDEKFKTDAFIICNTPEQVTELITIENFNKYVKYIGDDSEKYKSGDFYKVAASALDWQTPNPEFNRSTDQKAAGDDTEYSYTEVTNEAAGNGRIDIEQTVQLTDPSSLSWGTGAEANPRIPSTSNGQNNSSFCKKNLYENGAYNTFTMHPHSTWTLGIATDDINYDEVTRAIDNSAVTTTDGIIYGMTINRNAAAKPSESAREDFDSLTSKIYGAHDIKLAPNVSACSVRLNVQLFGYILCNQTAPSTNWESSATTEHSIFGSIWLKYTDINNIARVVRVYTTNLFRLNPPTPTSGRNRPQTEDSGYTTPEPVEIALPIADIKADDSGYINCQVIEVLEAYKTQAGSGTIAAANNVNLWAWAAFTDFKVATQAGLSIYTPYAKNPEVYSQAKFSNSNANAKLFVNSTPLKGAYLASVDMNINLDNGDRFIWKGLAVANGASYTVYTENDNRETLNISINSDGAIIVDGITPAAGQSITVKRLL